MPRHTTVSHTIDGILANGNKYVCLKANATCKEKAFCTRMGAHVTKATSSRQSCVFGNGNCVYPLIKGLEEGKEESKYDIDHMNCFTNTGHGKKTLHLKVLCKIFIFIYIYIERAIPIYKPYYQLLLVKI